MNQCKQCLEVNFNPSSNFCSQKCCDSYLINLIVKGIMVGIYVPQVNEKRMN